jgi:protein-L-isoaspartate(D-aspartate) O-methyltransferase
MLGFRWQAEEITMKERAEWNLDGITDERVLEAMNRVPREKFVPADQVDRAYENLALPIEHGQTISQPFIVAFMTQSLELEAGSKVLEVGCGSGYQSAVLAELVGHVFSVEIDPRLAQQAEKRLRLLGFENVSVKIGDGYDGWIEEAPFDAIIVTAAAEDVPPPLMDQLKDGGRLIIPLGTPFGAQELFLIEKHGSSTTTRSILPVRFVPFRRVADL